MLAILKVLKALFRFVKEIWLRDRTFRQFVRENLSLIVTSVGFMVMTLMFLHVYFVVKEQEDQLLAAEQNQNALKREIEEQVPFLKERMAWYQERYYELKTQQCQPVVIRSEPKGAPTPSSPPPKSTEKSIAARPPSSDLVERWKKLSQ